MVSYLPYEWYLTCRVNGILPAVWMVSYLPSEWYLTCRVNGILPAEWMVSYLPSEWYLTCRVNGILPAEWMVSYLPSEWYLTCRVNGILPAEWMVSYLPSEWYLTCRIILVRAINEVEDRFWMGTWCGVMDLLWNISDGSTDRWAIGIVQLSLLDLVHNFAHHFEIILHDIIISNSWFKHARSMPTLYPVSLFV